MSKLYRFKREEEIYATKEEIWKFISSPKNLQEITPEDMRFEILNNSADGEMYPGMVISYHISIFGFIKYSWVTEITHVVDKQYFVDEQRFGPFSFWHHKHFIMEREDHLYMVDIVDYKIPFGFIGDLANVMFVKKKLNQIFDFRSTMLQKLFPKK